MEVGIDRKSEDALCFHELPRLRTDEVAWSSWTPTRSKSDGWMR